MTLFVIFKKEGRDPAVLEDIDKPKREADRLKKELYLKSSVLCAAENRFLREEVEKLKNTLKGEEEVFLFRKISGKAKLVAHFTGLPNKETFYALLNLTMLISDITWVGKLQN